MRRLTFTLIVSAMLGSGCGRTPPLSGGKPVEHWVQAMRDPDAGVRRTAVTKLGNAGAATPEVWDALSGALRDRDAGVRRDAILALMKVGPKAQEAASTLAELRRHDPDTKVRAYASKALEKIGPSAKSGPPEP